MAIILIDIPHNICDDARMKTITIGNATMSAEDFAALWGCEPCYDHYPRIPGDGCMFYNFGSEHQIRDREFLENFLGAINRTIEVAKRNRNLFGYEDDINGLEQLKSHVQELIGQLPK